MTTSDDTSRTSGEGLDAPEGTDAGKSTAASRAGGTRKEVLAFFQAYSNAPAPLNLIYTYSTRTYLDRLPADPPAPEMLEKQLLALTNNVIREENLKIGKGDTRYPQTKHLSYWQIAQVLLRLHHVIRIAPTTGSYDREYDLLAMYNATGTRRGTYTTSEDDIRTMARRYNAALTLADFKELMAVLREDAPRKHVCRHRDLVAVNNGVFFYGTQDRQIDIDGRTFDFTAKSLHAFDPAMVFLAKSHVDYVPNAPAQVITHPVDGTVWEVSAWLTEMFDAEGQEGLTDLVWEILGAIIRPHVSWNKTAWFYSERGNNGKGTLCSLMRNLVGHDSHTSIPLSELGKDFALEPLIKANAIIVDENDVGTFIDKAANLKTIVTNDVIQINRKYRMPIAFQFFGLMVQCLNEFPRVKDKSESFYRRQLFVPFKKSFTGAERRYIKDDYLKRTEVLEYVLWYVLHQAGAADPGNYYEFSEPAATKRVLTEYKEANDPVRAYWNDVRHRLVWDLVPFPFLYDLYKAWFADVSPSGSPVSRQQFVKDLVGIVEDDDLFGCTDKNRKIRTSTLMNRPEPLIAEYDLKNWMNTSYKGTDPLQRSRFNNHQPNYRGLLRRPPAPGGATGADNTNTEPSDD